MPEPPPGRGNLRSLQVLHPQAPLASADAGVLSLAFSPDGQRLVYCLLDGRVFRVDAARGGEPEVLEVPKVHLHEASRPERRADRGSDGSPC